MMFPIENRTFEQILDFSISGMYRFCPRPTVKNKVAADYLMSIKCESVVDLCLLYFFCILYILGLKWIRRENTLL